MNVVITSLLTAVPDPQRNTYLPSNVSVVDALRRSLHCRMVVINDCLDEPDDTLTKFVRVPPGGNPYFARWRHIAAWLNTNAVDRVWCVDGTDVVMLHDPFPHMQDGKVYCGSEPYSLGGDSKYHKWLWNTCPSRRDFYRKHPERPFVNMGLLGGDSDDIASAAQALADSEADGDRWEMGAWQQIAHDMFGDRLVTGHPVHTVYRTLDHNDPEAWWAHQ